MKIRYSFALILVTAYVLSGCGSESYLEHKEASSVSSDSTEKETSSSEEASVIYVQIDGAVKSPGVYRMDSDDRVYALIEKAGGFRKNAYTHDINQAEALSDGQKIIVPTSEEHIASEKTASDGGAPDDRVDINTADATALTTISGIGPARAEAIIAYRTENGSFKDTKDITNVSGIGESTYNRIKDRIKV